MQAEHTIQLADVKPGDDDWFRPDGLTEPEEPRSTDEAIQLFANPDDCLRYLIFRRWPDGCVKCPVCSGSSLTWLSRRRMWECRNRHARSQFSVRTGTFMEDSRLSLGQWLTSLWLLAEKDMAVSSYEIARRVGMTQKSAWLLIRRIRRQMATPAGAAKVGLLDLLHPTESAMSIGAGAI